MSLNGGILVTRQITLKSSLGNISIILIFNATMQIRIKPTTERNISRAVFSQTFA